MRCAPWTGAPGQCMRRRIEHARSGRLGSKACAPTLWFSARRWHAGARLELSSAAKPQCGRSVPRAWAVRRGRAQLWQYAARARRRWRSCRTCTRWRPRCGAGARRAAAAAAEAAAAGATTAAAATAASRPGVGTSACRALVRWYSVCRRRRLRVWLVPERGGGLVARG